MFGEKLKIVSRVVNLKIFKIIFYVDPIKKIGNALTPHNARAHSSRCVEVHFFVVVSKATQIMMAHIQG